MKGVVDEWLDTYQFHIDSSAQDEELFAVHMTTYELVKNLADIDPEEGKSIVAGAIYWINAAGEEEPVGCAQVRADPEQGLVRYMGGNGMPTKLETQSETHRLWGRFLLVDLDVGQPRAKAFIDNVEIGQVQLVSYADSIAIANIYHEGDSNPTPAGCGE